MTGVDNGTPTIIDNLNYRLEHLDREMDNLVSKVRSAEELEELLHEFNMFKIDQDLVKNKLQDLELVCGDSGKEVVSKIQELSYSVDELERKMNGMKVWYEESGSSHPYHTRACYGHESSRDPLNLDPKDGMDKAKSELKEPKKSVQICVDQIESRDSECTGTELELKFSEMDKFPEDHIESEKPRTTTGIDAKELKNADEDRVNDQSNNKSSSGFESYFNTGLDKMMETMGLSAETNWGNRISLGERFKRAMGFSEENTSGTGHLQLSPSVDEDELMKIRFTLEDSIIEARARIRQLDELLSKFDKYTQDLASKKHRTTPGIEANGLKNANEDYLNDQSNNQGVLNVAGTSLESESMSSPSKDDDERRNAEVQEPNEEPEENA